MSSTVVEWAKRATKKPNWVSVNEYGLTRPAKPVPAEAFERVKFQAWPKSERELEPDEKLWATQPRVDANKVATIPLKVNDPIIILRLNNRDLVVDGHHRIARARKEGKKIKATVYDADLQVAKGQRDELIVVLSKHLKGTADDHDQSDHAPEGSRVGAVVATGAVAAGAVTAAVVLRNMRAAGGLMSLSRSPGSRWATGSISSFEAAGTGAVSRRFARSFQGRDFNSTIRNIERQIRNQPREFAFIVDDRGRVLGGFAGTREGVSVAFPERIPLATRRRLTMTHNHPSGSTLSMPDSIIGMRENLNSMRVVHPDGHVSAMRFKRAASTQETASFASRLNMHREAYAASVAEQARRTNTDAMQLLTDWDSPVHGGMWESVANSFSDLISFERIGDIAKHMLGRHDQKTHGRWAHDSMRFQSEVLGQEVRWSRRRWLNPSGDTLMNLLGNPGAREFHYKTSPKHPGMALLWNDKSGDAALLSQFRGQPSLRKIGGTERLFRRGQLLRGQVQAGREVGEKAITDSESLGYWVRMRLWI
jgi:hypothetical protein